MTIFLLEHLKGCTPAIPCLSCGALAFLRGKISSEDLKKFMGMVYEAHGRQPPPPPQTPADGRPLTIDDLNIRDRVLNSLKNENISSLDDLCNRTEAELLRARNFGRKALNEVKEALHVHGRHLAPRPE